MVIDSGVIYLESVRYFDIVGRASRVKVKDTIYWEEWDQSAC